jgi:hypothetical protein
LTTAKSWKRAKKLALAADRETICRPEQLPQSLQHALKEPGQFIVAEAVLKRRRRA